MPSVTGTYKKIRLTETETCFKIEIITLRTGIFCFIQYIITGESKSVQIESYIQFKCVAVTFNVRCARIVIISKAKAQSKIELVGCI